MIGEPDESPGIPEVGQFTRHLPARGAYDWDAIADLLVMHPNQWTLAFRQERYSIVVAILSNRISALLSENGFRVSTRKNSRSRPRIADIYLSYQPEHDQRKPEW